MHYHRNGSMDARIRRLGRLPLNEVHATWGKDGRGAGLSAPSLDSCTATSSRQTSCSTTMASLCVDRFRQIADITGGFKTASGAFTAGSFRLGLSLVGHAAPVLCVRDAAAYLAAARMCGAAPAGPGIATAGTPGGRAGWPARATRPRKRATQTANHACPAERPPAHLMPLAVPNAHSEFAAAA